MVSSLATVQGTTERLLALSEVSEELVREPLLRLMSIRGHSSAERASALQAWLQPPIRRHQHPEGQDRGEGPVRGSLLCTGRYGEPDQGAATRSLRRPDLTPHDAGQPAAGVLLGLRGCCGPDHPQVRAESHKAGEGSGRDHPHSAAENRRIGSGPRRERSGSRSPRSTRGANSSSGSLATSPPPSRYTQHPGNAFEPRSPLPLRMGHSGAVARRPLHSRFTHASRIHRPAQHPNRCFPPSPRTDRTLTLPPPLFRKARSRTLSTPGDGSGPGMHNPGMHNNVYFWLFSCLGSQAIRDTYDSFHRS